MMNIKLVLIRSAKDKIDITNLVENITWSGDINTLQRTLEVSLRNADDIPKSKRLIKYDPGMMVMFYLDKKELFRGFIFRKSSNHTGSESFTAYDELIYATKNADTLLVRNKTASDVISTLCRKYGIAIGKISPTGFKIKKMLFENQSLSDIFHSLLAETTKNNKKHYKMYSSQGKVYLYPRSDSQKVTIAINDVISASNEVSIEELKTQVLVTKGSLDNDSTTTQTKKKLTPKQKAKKEAERRQNAFKTVTVKNSSLISKYGIMQMVESVDEKTTFAQMKAKANSLLAQNNKPDWQTSIDFIGNPSCITGYKLKVQDDLSGINGNLFITSDTHTFSGGVHKMTLQLSSRLE